MNLYYQPRTALKFVILSEFAVSVAFTWIAYRLIGTTFYASF